MNIGDKVKYKDVYAEPGVGVIVDVSSSMTSYDGMKLEDGIPYYISKKLSIHEIDPVYGGEAKEYGYGVSNYRNQPWLHRVSFTG